MENNYSLSDIAALNNGNGFCGGSAWILIILFAMIFNGGGFFGNRGGDYGAFASAASQQEILYGQRFSGLDNKLDRLGNGIADATYAITGNITGEGRALQMQIADCCCSTKEAIHAEGEATRAMLQQSKIESLQAQVNQLNLQQQLCGVVRYPNSMSFNAGPSPFCNCGNGFNGYGNI